MADDNVHVRRLHGNGQTVGRRQTTPETTKKEEAHDISDYFRTTRFDHDLVQHVK